MRREHRVNVTFRESTNVALLLEQLRYAGVIVMHDEQTHNFDILPPKGISDSKAWAEMNVRRMQSFMIRAEVR